LKIVCLGDSLTYGYGIARTGTWVALASKKSGHVLLNKGISGDTTGGMLSRFSVDVLQNQPDAVFLMGGYNDIFMSGSSQVAQSNMMAMVHQAYYHRILPFVGIPIQLMIEMIEPRFSSFVDFKALQNTCTGYYRWLEGFGAAFRTPVISFWETLEGNDGLPDPILYLDGLHPSKQGHLRMSDCFCQTLETGIKHLNLSK
jgi:lysophospholipase L1-like esterase